LAKNLTATLLFTGYALVSMGCKPESTNAAPKAPDSTVSSGSVQAPEKPGSANPDVSWCTHGKPGLLGRWKAGKSDMLVSSCTEDSADGQGVNQYSRLEVRQEDLSKNREVVWKIRDSQGVGLSSISLVRPSYAQLDVDGDGEMETFFGYTVISDGLDPMEVKFMAHKGGKKFAIRGLIPKVEDDSAAYKMEYDPAFATAEPRFKAVADSLLKVFVAASCLGDDGTLSFPIPRPLKIAGTK